MKEEKKGQEYREPRPARQQGKKYLVSTKMLYIILAVLCVILAAALAGQEYYFAHTYKKGELAQSTQGETIQRKKYLVDETEAQTEAPAETPAEAPAEAQPDIVIEPESEAKMPEQQPVAGEE